MHNSETHDRLIPLVAQIVSAYVGNNVTPTEALPHLIRDIHETLISIGAADHAAETETRPHVHSAPPPAAATRSVAADHLVCLEDGLTMKMLKRHLITVHGLTPDQYRAKWGLPTDYPMVAANYAKLRSSLAKESGLGLRPEARSKRARA